MFSLEYCKIVKNLFLQKAVFLKKHFFYRLLLEKARENLATPCLSMFDHFVNLALKGLIEFGMPSQLNINKSNKSAIKVQTNKSTHLFIRKQYSLSKSPGSNLPNFKNKSRITLSLDHPK